MVVWSSIVRFAFKKKKEKKKKRKTREKKRKKKKSLKSGHKCVNPPFGFRVEFSFKSEFCALISLLCLLFL